MKMPLILAILIIFHPTFGLGASDETALEKRIESKSVKDEKKDSSSKATAQIGAKAQTQAVDHRKRHQRR